MVFDMVLSSNSRSAEIPGTKGVTRFAFFEVGVLDSVARYPLGLRLPAGPAFLHTSAPVPVARTATPPPTPTRKIHGYVQGEGGRGGSYLWAKAQGASPPQIGREGNQPQRLRRAEG